MPAISETAYPRFKTTIGKKELRSIYTPSITEIKYDETSINTPYYKINK